MPWNWELPDWPNFRYDPKRLAEQERQFLLRAGKAAAYLENVGEQEQKQFIVEILSTEGLKSSKIEGEILDRMSLQSSIKKQFGFQNSSPKKGAKESRMAELLFDVYETYEKPLSDEMLCHWYEILMNDASGYRKHEEPMQIVSSRYGATHVFFEAPPSSKIPKEMKAFIAWFNNSRKTETILGRAALAHVYFESIHPFEDGNGRIGRLLIEKVLSQGIGGAILIAVSKVFEKRPKEYYAALEKCNRTLEVQEWVEFFAQVVLQAQEESMQLLDFLLMKHKLLASLAGQLNERQEKVLLRMFTEGPTGFKGGLSAENYIAITKSSRATATRDLADLVEKGALVKTGELRHTRYSLRMDNGNTRDLDQGI